MARLAGAGEGLPAELGAAALAARLGALVDPGDPQPAAARWLLALGADPLWERCARLVLEIDAPEAGAAARLVRSAEAVALGVAGECDDFADVRSACEQVLAGRS
jgi:hypothetical protein